MVAGILPSIAKFLFKMRRILEKFSSPFKEHSVLFQCCCSQWYISTIFSFPYLYHPLVIAGVTLEDLMKFIVRKVHCVWYVCFKGISTGERRLWYILQIYKLDQWFSNCCFQVLGGQGIFATNPWEINEKNKPISSGLSFALCFQRKQCKLFQNS